MANQHGPLTLFRLFFFGVGGLVRSVFFCTKQNATESRSSLHPNPFALVTDSLFRDALLSHFPLITSYALRPARLSCLLCYATLLYLRVDRMCT